MNKISGSFFEEHAEKIVLIVFCVLAMGILVTRVLLSPNRVSYDNRKFSPADLDGHIAKKALILENKLNNPPQPHEPYVSKLDKFTGMMQVAANIDTRNDIALPMINDREIASDMKYNVPDVGPVVKNPLAEHIRSVAYIPTEEITFEKPYNSTNSELGDLDFITVQAEIDLQSLYDRFNEAFAGSSVPVEWRDPCLAKPVFTAVELQRQYLLEDGQWSQWQRVERAKVDSFKEMFDIVEDARYLPEGGMRVRMLQYNNPLIQKALLQPPPYSIASAGENWFPPRLHKEFAKMVTTEQNRIKQIKRQLEILERERLNEDRRRLRMERSSRANNLNPDSGDDQQYMTREERRQKSLEERGRDNRTRRPGLGDTTDPRNPGLNPGTRRNPRAGRNPYEEEDPTMMLENMDSSKFTEDLEAFMEKFVQVLITPEKGLKQMDPLVIWAHDDSVEPGRTYRYRIRIGCLNPIAGTDMFKEEEETSKKNQAILWSDFASPPQSIDVPAKSYFFAHEINDSVGYVRLEVFKYILGYWYNDNFTVKPGETIGSVRKNSVTTTDVQITVPTTIDYSTGAVLVDTMAVNKWSIGKSPKPTTYYKMIYCDTENKLKYQPVQRSYWPIELSNTYSSIQSSQKEERKPFRNFQQPGMMMDMGMEMEMETDMFMGTGLYDSDS